MVFISTYGCGGSLWMRHRTSCILRKSLAMHRVVACCKGYWMRIFFKWIYIYNLKLKFLFLFFHRRCYWVLSSIMIEFSCSFHKGNKIWGRRSRIKWFEWKFGKIIKYIYIDLPTSQTIRSWWSHWVVVIAYHCYLWLRLWLDVLWAIIVNYDYTCYHVSLKLLLWIF